MNIKSPMSLKNYPMIERDDWILSKTKGRKVLHAGATDNYLTEQKAASDSLLHSKLKQNGCDLIGIDIDLAGIDYLREHHGLNDIIHGDLETADQIFQLEKFDVILAADVLEHLNNPGLFLASARKILKTNGELIITVPNTFSLKKFLGVALLRQERTHPDHVCYYSLMNLYQLLGRFGFDLIEINTFLWRDDSRKINLFANHIANITIKILRNTNIADEFAIVAKIV